MKTPLRYLGYASLPSITCMISLLFCLAQRAMPRMLQRIEDCLPPASEQRKLTLSKTVRSAILRLAGLRASWESRHATFKDYLKWTEQRSRPSCAVNVSLVLIACF